MNFFGHAWVAAWFSEAEPFLLGAMLPDFASALRSAVPASPHAELAAGIRLHHETDRVFHATESFQALEHRARCALGAAGLSKGPRRALAHVGVEFLIDDELGRPPAGASVVAGYLRALRFGASPDCRSLLHWRNAFDAERFGHLCARLASATWAASQGLRSDADGRLALRLVACLAGRPRLELQPDEEAALEPWLAECRPLVAAAIPGLLGELARGLDAPAPAQRGLCAAE